MPQIKSIDSQKISQTVTKMGKSTKAISSEASQTWYIYSNKELTSWEISQIFLMADFKRDGNLDI
jgi:hypothetical protein